MKNYNNNNYFVISQKILKINNTIREKKIILKLKSFLYIKKKFGAIINNYNNKLQNQYWSVSFAFPPDICLQIRK